MKKVKMSLGSIQGKLTRNEMKNLVGGKNEPALMSCSCSNGANPPYSSAWTYFYESGQQMVSDINTICVGGAGSCTATSIPL